MSGVAAALDNGPAPVFTPEQLEDFATLFARELPRGNLVWLMTQTKVALGEAANQADELEFAKAVVQALAGAGKLRDALVLLQDGKKASLLMLGISYIRANLRLKSLAQQQAFINRVQPLISSDAFMETFPKIARTVCAIGIGGFIRQIMGTGFLVGPDLVLTNAHVVAPLLDLTADPLKENASGDDLVCFFDYISAPTPTVPYDETSGSGVMAVQAVANGWLRAARAPLPYDGTDQCPPDAENRYDYALIQLRQQVGTLPSRRSGGEPRGWLVLPDETDVDTKHQRIIVHQHPEAFPLQFDIGDYQGLDPTGTRVRYQVSTAHGSSGGVAVDVDGQLFALHNAEVEPPALKQNQGVRIDRIAEDLEAKLPNWDAFPEVVEQPFWSLNEGLDDPKPVIGRDAFRQNVLDMSKTTGKRVMVVWGPRGSGRTYSVELLRRTLDSEARVVVYSADELTTLSPEQFAAKLVDGIGITNVAEDKMPEPKETEAPARGLRTDLPAWIARWLARLAEKTPTAVPVWLVLNAAVEDFNWKDNIRDLVAALSGVHDPGQQLIEQPHLRLVVLASSPAGLPIGSVPRFEDDLTNYTAHAAEFEACVRRAYFALDKTMGVAESEFLNDLAGATVEDMEAAGHRKALSDLVRRLVLQRLKKGQP